MKKGDVVWCWDKFGDDKVLRLFVEKKGKGCHTSIYQSMEMPLHYTHCEPYEPAQSEFKSGDKVQVSGKEDSWMGSSYMFIGFHPNGQAVVENSVGFLVSYPYVRHFPKTRTVVKSITECVRLLVNNGWTMDDKGVWSNITKSLPPKVHPNMLFKYREDYTYPKFLLEEVDECR